MGDILQAAAGWVQGLPLPALYLLLAVTAVIESLFPPAPADVIVAFGSFLAARRDAPLTPTVLSIVVGSAIGAWIVYLIARRFGADWLHRQLAKVGAEGAEVRLESLYGRYGLLALFVSRFMPGLRAVVAPMAGALRVPLPRFLAVVTVASGVWYGIIGTLAYRAGENWEQLRERITALGQGAAVAAVALGVVGAATYVVWWRRRESRRAEG